MNIKELFESRKKTHEDMKALGARAEFGVLEQEQWDKLDAEYMRLDALISEETRNHKINERARELSAPQFSSRLSGASAGADFASREYNDAFAASLRTGRMSDSIRALTTSTSNAPVPVDMQRRIVELMQKVQPLRSLASVYQAATDQKITVESGIPTGYLVDEAGSITASDPSFSVKNVTDYTFACRVQVSYQAYNDYVNGGTYLARKISQGLGIVEETNLMSGSGSGTPTQPTGAITAIKAATGQRYVATASTTGNGYTTIAADDIIETVHTLSPQYRMGSAFRWLMLDAMAKTVRKLKDSQNRYLWQVSDNVTEGLTNGINGNLYGVPVTVSQFMPTTTAANDVAAVVGDWSTVEIYDRGPIEFAIDNLTGLSSLQIYLQTWKRSDVVVPNTAAFAYLAFK